MRKLFYLPGVISLIGFIFLLPYSYKRITPKKRTGISINVPKEPAPDENWHEMFSTRKLLTDTKKKKKLNFVLTNDQATNKKKTALIRFEARKLKYTYDTTSVIMITLTEDVTYGNFFELINLCITDSIKKYATWDKLFVIFGESPPAPETQSLNYCCFLCGDVITVPPKPKKKSLIEKINSLIKPFNISQIMGLALGWLVLILTAINYQKRNTITMPPSSIP